MVGKASRPLARHRSANVPRLFGGDGMSWTEGRRRPICKKVMFAPEEWERAERLRQALMKESLRAAIAYRRWGEYARERLLYPVVEMPRVVLAAQLDELRRQLDRITELMEGMERAKEEMEARGGKRA